MAEYNMCVIEICDSEVTKFKTLLLNFNLKKTVQSIRIYGCAEGFGTRFFIPLSEDQYST
jgi:hypothetical protein